MRWLRYLIIFIWIAKERGMWAWILLLWTLMWLAMAFFVVPHFSFDCRHITCIY